MSYLVFDIETNSKYINEVTKIHSIVMMDTYTKEIGSYRPNEVELGVKQLEKAECIIGHNIIGYDCRVIESMYPSTSLPTNIFDTLIAAKLKFPDIASTDKAKRNVPEELIGKHSLEAWGYRLGIHKGTYGKKENAWDKWSEEMQQYCEQDVQVTLALYHHLIGDGKMPMRALDIEQQFQYLIDKQISRGILIDQKALWKNIDMLTPKKEEIFETLQNIFPPKIVKEVFLPKRNDKTRGYVAGVEFIKEHKIEFNPHSDDHVRERLTALGWVPMNFTPTGKPKVSEEDIEGFDHPSVKILLEYKKVNNALTKLYTGKASWYSNIGNDGRVHGNVYPFGTVTRRCSHSSPNVTQLLKNDYFKGTSLEGICTPRDICIATEGYSIVGCDASGLEARCLGEYTFPYDDGELANELINGDIHSKNLECINSVLAPYSIDRKKAKTALYATMYGASARKVGASLGFPSHGEKIRQALYEAMPSFGQLKKDVEDTAKQRGFIYSIDGGTVPIERGQDYIALNYLLQGCGAIVMKQAYINLYNLLTEKGWVWGREYAIIMYNHDEFQAEVSFGNEDEFGKAAVEAIKQAGVDLNMHLELDGAYEIGGRNDREGKFRPNNWAGTH